LKSTYKIFAMTALAGLIVTTAIATSFWSFNQIKQATKEKEHVNVVISNAENLLSMLKDAESGQRGYLLTGDDSFLEPYLHAKNNIVADLNLLHQQTKIQASQQHLATISPLISAKLADMAIAIELRRNQEIDKATIEVRQRQGKRLMDSIRAELNEFSKVEKASAMLIDIQLQSTMRRMFNIIILAGVSSTLFALAFIYLVYRRNQQKFKDLVHLETKSLLKKQEDSNKQLVLINTSLEISEEKLAVTINSIGDAVIVTDDKGNLTMFNPLAEKLTGWSKAEAIGLPVSDVFHILNQETRQPKAIPILETLEHGTIQGMANHTVLISRNGSESSIADSCAPIRNKTGKMVGTVMVFRDVSKEYATQRQLSDSAAIIEAILNSVVDGIITFHARDGIIKTVNPSAERMFGYDATELIGKNFSILIPELDQNKRDGTLSDYKASKEAIATGHGREVIGWGKGNIAFPVEIAVNEMWLGGIRFFSCILRDITLRKLVEENQIKTDAELKHKNAELELATILAEKANLAKSDFLSNMSHELRTPLGAILGFAQLIESGKPTPTPKQKKSIDQILKAGWYLLDLINEILDLALIESGKMSISLEPVSLAEVMRECQAMIEPQALKRDININFSQFDGPYFVKADHTRIKQILINLLSNAIKYNKVGGDVNITHTLTNHDCIRISIQDTGAGLSADLIAQLFQPFNRLGKNAKDEVGTGIGLVVCKRLIDLMGGKIGIKSKVGEGSVFWIELNLIIDTQLTHQDQDQDQETILYDEKRPLFSLLYVEDNPANLMLVEDIIARRNDITLLSAIDAKQGINMARTLLPDLILMDINLPGISGLDAMKILSKDAKTAHIPVIALSANAIPHDIEKGLQAGFFRYLTKPIRVIEFMKTLDIALNFTKDKSNQAKE
jgi:PAS domain S-box-containing protein